MENPPETLTSSAVANASIELLERLNASESPLSIVSSALLSLATTLGVDRAIVAIDDPHYGRQVFCSGRRLLGDDGDMLWGTPRMRTVAAAPDPRHATPDSSSPRSPPRSSGRRRAKSSPRPAPTR